MPSLPCRIIIVGAGIIGVVTAAALRREGHDVVIIDRLPPGEACSFGNSGGMPRNHSFPMAMPGIVWNVPRYLADPRGPLAIRWQALPRIAPFLLRFLRASAKSRFLPILDHLTAMMQQSHADWTGLIGDAGLGVLIRDDGALTLYRSNADRSVAWATWQLLVDRGAELQTLDGQALTDLEPAVPAGYHSAVFEPDYRRTIDPHGLCVGVARHVERIGGRLKRETVSEIVPTESNHVLVRTNLGEHVADRVVIAAGAWSGNFARRFGDWVPLEPARGYHATITNFSPMPKRPLFIADRKLSLNPMATGLRTGGNIEFAGLGQVPDFARPARQLDIVRDLYPNAEVGAHTKWAGDRPMMPDSLPVIGRSPRHPNIIYAFGHGQYGLALAAVTGRLVAEIVGERPTTLDIAPFKPDRF
ncbi:D-amino-acid dehydrogenase [Rhodoligotrophos appendicifer]|uniref:NAD(P)/FAD-dependent oxidoreductase n=1 Tax=Rhodoligotrophos appendicifer TaxID=987056 RepID=UPI0011847C95|nr:FAD-dependent oxidoreductase [Rhodoligotrophos appendicifer]